MTRKPDPDVDDLLQDFDPDEEAGAEDPFEKVFPDNWTEQTKQQEASPAFGVKAAASLSTLFIAASTLLATGDGEGAGSDGATEQTQFVSMAEPFDLDEALRELKAEAQKPNFKFDTTKGQPRAGDVFQQGVSNMLETIAKHGSGANGKNGIRVELDPEKGSNPTVKENIEKRTRTMERLQTEGWKVIQSKPGSIADMAGYDIVMVNDKGQWFPVDTTLNRAGKGGKDNLLIDSNGRHFDVNRDGSVTLKQGSEALCDKVVDAIGKIMDKMGGPQGDSFPTLEELRPPDLDSTQRKTHNEILEELREYRKKVSDFANNSETHKELLLRLDNSIKHRQSVAMAETLAQANIDRELGEVLKKYAEKVQKGTPQPGDAAAKNFDIADGKQTVSIDRKGNVTVNDVKSGDPLWSEEKRTQLEVGDFRKMVDAKLEQVVPDKATREKIIQILDADPKALNQIFNELGVQMKDIVDIARTLEHSRRRPASAAERASTGLTEKHMGDFFKELGENGKGDKSVLENKTTNELLSELTKQRQSLNERQKEFEKAKEALRVAEERVQAAVDKKREPTKDAKQAVADAKKLIDTGFADLGTPEKPGHLTSGVAAIEAELSKRVQGAFDKALGESMNAFRPGTIDMFDAIRGKARVTVGETTGVFFKDKSGKEYALTDLASDGRITTTTDGRPALRMEGQKDPIPLENLEVEIRVSKDAKPEQAQRELFKNLTELKQAMTFDERRDGGKLNTIKAKEQAAADRAVLDGDLQKSVEKAQRAAERELFMDAARKSLDGFELKPDLSADDRALVGETLKDTLNDLKENMSEETRKQLELEIEKYGKNEGDSVKKMHDQVQGKAEATTEKPATTTEAPKAPVTEQGSKPLFEKLPQRLKTQPPTDYNPDVKDALAEVIESNRSKWKGEYLAEMEKLCKDYEAGDKAAIERVNKMMAEGKTASATPQTGTEAKTVSAPDKVPTKTTPTTETKPVNAVDKPKPVEVTQQYTSPELTPEKKPTTDRAIETLTSADGLKFIESIPIGDLTVARVGDKMNNIDKEIALAKERGMHDYARELETMKKEYEGKKSPAEKEAYCREVMKTVREAHELASGKGKGKGGGIAGKAGTVVAFLLIGGWLLDIAAPSSMGGSSGPRVQPGKG